MVKLVSNIGVLYMIQCFYGKQNIIDINSNIVGGELFYRDSLTNNSYPNNVDSYTSTARLAVNFYLSPNSSMRKVSGKVFVNFDKQCLCDELPTLFNSKDTVIEILETCVPDEELLVLVKKYKSMGFSIALDDYVYSDDWIDFFPYVDFIKIDIKNQGLAEASKIIKKLKGFDLVFIAEKVESKIDVDYCVSIGFKYFQGYYFGEPIVYDDFRLDFSHDTISLSVEIFDLLSKSNTELYIGETIDKISFIISESFLLTYSILKISAYTNYFYKNYNLRKTITEIGYSRLYVFFKALCFHNNYESNANQYYYIRGKNMTRLAKDILSRTKGFINVEFYTASIVCVLSQYPSSLGGVTNIMNELRLSDRLKRGIIFRDNDLGLLLDISDEFMLADAIK